ncbi:ThuA domain-containing protein [Roseiconus nitratireducens]|uniref:ThuA domain-containing protein n=1 Tax=Roseiconus nitratireducens TaxID=2605748 RepID=A0A5M6DCS4_9BACT|nr:ThuA domain-containing protein [Roseiconus nitratireducens]KAA5545193.1 ThuA domain-containing protein [Roseiconus nitratireducens]
MMSRTFPVLAGLLCLVLTANPVGHAVAEEVESGSKPLNILLITSGCCHDYDFQTKSMQLAFKRAGVDANWTVVNEGGTGTEAQIDFYGESDWAKGFDVCIHNECFANTTDADYIRSITGPHREGLPAVVIHCAMHTYRGASIDDWRQLLGVTSRRHEHKSAYPVEVVAEQHPIMESFPDGHTIQLDELYVIEKVWPNATVLATSKSEKTGQSHPVIWTNQFGKARVFGTTYGHSNETFEDQEFLKLLVRGTVWAARGDR